MGPTIAVLIIACSLLGATAANAATTVEPARVFGTGQSDLLALINGYRAANGLHAVSANAALASAATWMAADMATRNYFSHSSSDGRTPVQRMAGTGYPAYSMYTGENIAAGFAAAADVLRGWQNSDPHNATLLSPNFDAVGIGVAYDAGSTYKWYWDADFAGAGVSAVPIALAAPPPAANGGTAAATRVQTASRAQPAHLAEAVAPATDPAAAAEAERLARIETLAFARFEHLLRVLARLDIL